MRRWILLALTATGLSGCVTEDPGYYDSRPYRPGPVIVEDYRGYDRYPGPRVYRDYPDYRYERGRYDRPYRRPRAERYDRYDNPVLFDRRDPRRYDDRRPFNRPVAVRPQPGRPPVVAAGPIRPGPIEDVRTDLPDQPRYRQLRERQALEQQGGGPRPYIPPVPVD